MSPTLSKKSFRDFKHSVSRPPTVVGVERAPLVGGVRSIDVGNYKIISSDRRCWISCRLIIISVTRRQRTPVAPLNYWNAKASSHGVWVLPHLGNCRWT